MFNYEIYVQLWNISFGMNRNSEFACNYFRWFSKVFWGIWWQRSFNTKSIEHLWEVFWKVHLHARSFTFRQQRTAKFLFYVGDYGSPQTTNPCRSQQCLHLFHSAHLPSRLPFTQFRQVSDSLDSHIVFVFITSGEHYII